MDMLLWSVKPKKTPDDRKQLVSRLPALLKRLNAGLAAISMDAAEQKEFFANLVTIHTRVIKSSLGGEITPPETNAELAWTVVEPAKHTDAPTNTILDAVNEASAEAALVRKNVSEGDIQIEEVTLANESKIMPDDHQDHRWADLTASMKRGSWVDFKQQEGHYLRYKLSWVSPLKNIYLFTNMSNQKALSISPQAMEKQMREGTARLIEDAPLMDRAVENMLESLQQRNQ
jgi:hypothetical protein